MNNRFVILLVIFILYSVHLQAQQKASISGKIITQDSAAIIFANVTIKDKNLGTSSNISGHYKLNVPANEDLIVVFSCIGYATQYIPIRLKEGENLVMNKVMQVETHQLDEVSVTKRQDLSGNIQRIDIKSFDKLPNMTGNVESLIKIIGVGVSSNNELSSQYSVRGGSFDENLVYVNDVEIYRPQLIRSGQQEGLSFVNSSLVQSIKFSAGGFDASYGDKMSSVLDITYRKPQNFAGSAEVSLLGQSAHFEGISKNKKFTYLVGARYKSTSYVLNSLETKGEYLPSFVDVQTALNYEFTSKLELSFMGYYAQNKYTFKPENRESEFGSYDNPIGVTIYYDGAEYDQYTTTLGAFTLNFKPNKNVSLKLITSAYTSDEQENFDIQGQYWINQLANRNDNATRDSLSKIDVGTLIDHARNKMQATVFNVSHKGSWMDGENKVRWGVNWQVEDIEDVVREWEMLDSAGYSLPYSDSEITLINSVRANNKVFSNRLGGYAMATHQFFIHNAQLFINLGLRANYWDLNNELIVSPRGSVSLKPDWTSDYLFYFSTGLYAQPAFYREMRAANGSVNTNLKSQKSFHYVLGIDHGFAAWERPFKLTTELYYKNMWDIDPYKINNVRLQYAAQNLATGYVTGVDFKLNGQFVEGTDSWVSLSIMRARQNIKGDYYTNSEGNKVDIGYFPAPTDQLMSLNVFFQDYLPRNPSYKVHLNLVFASRLPMCYPNTDRYDRVFRMPSYRRVDLGFSKMLKSEDQVIAARYNPLKFFKTAWISAEVFNLMGFNNTNSYLWIKTVSDNAAIPYNYLAVPNYLTSRRFNVKLSLTF
jgi:hypothetical protein